MSTLLAEKPMAKAKAKEPQPPQSVRLPGDVVESARIVAAFRNESMADVMANILRPALKKMERDEMAKRTEEGR